MDNINNILTAKKPKPNQEQSNVDGPISEPEWTRLRQTLTQDCANKMAFRTFGCDTREHLASILRGYPLPSTLRRDEQVWKQIVKDEAQVFSNEMLESRMSTLRSVFPDDGKSAGEHIADEFHDTMPAAVAWFHTLLIDTSLEMSIQHRGGGSLLQYLYLPAATIEGKLYDWVRLNIRARILLQDDDELVKTCADLSESAHYAIIPYLLIGAVRPASSDTAARAVERLNDCFELMCSERFRMLQDKKIPQVWVETAKSSLKIVDSMYAMYLESFITRLASAVRKVSLHAANSKSPIKQTPSTTTHRKAPIPRPSLNDSSIPKPRSSHDRPAQSPTRVSGATARTTIAPESSTPSNSDVTRAQAQAQERVRVRRQGSLDVATSVRTAEIAPGIVRRRQVAYGSPVKKAGGVNAKPAWR